MSRRTSLALSSLALSVAVAAAGCQTASSNRACPRCQCQSGNYHAIHTQPCRIEPPAAPATENPGDAAAPQGGAAPVPETPYSPPPMPLPMPGAAPVGDAPADLPPK